MNYIINLLALLFQKSKCYLLRDLSNSKGTRLSGHRRFFSFTPARLVMSPVIKSARTSSLSGGSSSVISMSPSTMAAPCPLENFLENSALECFHSNPRDTTDKEQGGHVGVTKQCKLISIQLLRGHQHGGRDVTENAENTTPKVCS